MAKYSTELRPFVENRAAGGGRGADRILPAQHEAGVKFSQATFNVYGDTGPGGSSGTTTPQAGKVWGMIELPVNICILDMQFGWSALTSAGSPDVNIVAYNIDNPDGSHIVLSQLNVPNARMGDLIRTKSLVTGGNYAASTYISLNIKPWDGLNTPGVPYFTDNPSSNLSTSGGNLYKSDWDISSVLTAQNETKIDKWGIGIEPIGSGHFGPSDRTQADGNSVVQWNETTVNPGTIYLSVLYSQ